MWLKLLTPFVVPLLKGLGGLILRLMPVERIVAWLLNRWLATVNPTQFDRFVRSARHITELGDLLAGIVEDRKIAPAEATDARERIMRLREMLLEDWAEGRSAKNIEKMLVE